MSSHSSDKKRLLEVRSKTKQLEAEYEELEEQLRMQEKEAEDEEKRAANAEEKSQQVGIDIKRLEAIESQLDNMIAALTVANEVRTTFSTTILDQQHRMSRTIRDEYKRMKDFESKTQELVKKKDASTDCSDLESGVINKLHEIVNQVKSKLTDKLKKKGVPSTSTSTSAVPESSGTTRRRAGRPSSASQAAKRKRDSSESTPSQTPYAASKTRGSTRRTYFQESDETDE